MTIFVFELFLLNEPIYCHCLLLQGIFENSYGNDILAMVSQCVANVFLGFIGVVCVNCI